MFIISKQEDGNFTLICKVYSEERHSHEMIYSARNITWDTVASLVQQGLTVESDIDMASDLLRLTNIPAVINDDGTLKADLTGTA